MITYTQGNLLDAEVEAVVNTVNTVGVMGKGIALMFREAFPENFKLYAQACKKNEVQIGRMFVTECSSLLGPKWIINFPTKKHWRQPSKMEWLIDGLQDLKRIIQENDIRSIAVPPLGSGNGGLDWQSVRPHIAKAFGELVDVKIIVYEPTSKYQNFAKRSGVQILTPARALVAELVRRYEILGIDCSLLEIQKLAWFLERHIKRLSPDNPLNLSFVASKYGPYANRLTHLLDKLDGSYLHCDKRLSDARPSDVIWFNDAQRDRVGVYLKSAETKPYLGALEATANIIDGFESPLGMELLATVDWLYQEESCEPTVDAVRAGLANWTGGKQAAQRKLRLFDDRLIEFALKQLAPLHAA